ncbi:MULTISPECIES: amino acid ABC transporter permease [Aerococcus]|uniref:Amino acid ABC transporter permease n=1 Tax=Aerococcus loyolae TaxID=2976809 RepID=A0ABT4BXK6_9LACT|nr:MULTISPECIES: amino acid ABC transporter permease [Aerococcus]KAA9220740.1 amino acid ABC transporter permease [Aerococcus loyolae]KAA9265688.1 amino acid ABC transporter permease [Aerococcus loyolae]MCY3024999.1 amino acid ABC transporter permease [Aerococcus loyolae]MCY3026945.1 amino acid ABC transporter permease [Aerococcus loyolae]MCY3028529.1 amino acid ABC transporter permease [Aerococcus loyolae]
MLNSGIRILFEANNLLRLLLGLWVTLRIALISMALSLVLGTLMGILMTGRQAWLKALLKVYLEIVRVIPQLVLVFLVYFGAAKHLALNFSAEGAAIIAFTFWGTAEIGELVRSAIVSLPAHQAESGQALALTPWQLYRYILIPQTVTRLLPSLTSLMTRMIKTTAIVVLVGVVEVIEVGKQIIDANRFQYANGAIWVYGAIFFLYFLLCYPFSKLSQYLEKKVKEGGQR